ncbi:tripartite tricarboxylate transporter substrate binding protein [Pusillimonas sp. TS35]|nr:tripartite tricarboxylate transporter substrate binding protein [Pusillimonas sp. TS35]
MLALAGAIGAATVAPAPAFAAFPDKPIQVTISFPPGGATDVLARALGQQMGAVLGQSVVVENRTGAGGAIGLAAGARQAPNGYGLYLAATTNQAIAAAIYKDQPVHLAKDFVPIGLIGFVPHALVVPASLPVSNVAELIAYIKAKPGQYNYASQGVGTLSHLEGTLFSRQNALDITHVPYKGSSQALPDVVSGVSSMMFDSVTGSMPLVKGGKLKYLAVASGQRVSLLPDVPTLKESGIANVVADNQFGLFAPKGTPPDIIATLSAALEQSLKNPKLITAMAAQGAELRYGPPDALAKVVNNEHAFWGNVVKEANIRSN